MENKEYEEALWRIYNCNDDDYTLGYRQHDYRLLQQALTTKSKKNQAFEIIKNKNVDIYSINVCINVEHYNSVIKSKNFNNNYSYEIWYELTQEEWDLLKEVLKNED